MKNVAMLWWDNHLNWDNTDQPFEKGWKSDAYAKFAGLGRERDLKFVAGDYRWYSEGNMEKAWYYDGSEWTKVRDVKLDGVYDLFRYDQEKKSYKDRMKEEVGIMDDPELTKKCRDKLKTYQMFSEFVPETRKATDENFEEMIEKYGKVIFKPRYGSGGTGIEIIEEKSEFEEPEEPKDYIIQKFVETRGAPFSEVEGPHDLRILMINGEPQYAYFRFPNEGKLSNLNQGGSLEYVRLGDLPDECFEIVERVNEEFEGFNPSVYTVDLMFSTNNEPKILELNTSPGVYYHRSEREKEHELPVMKSLVKALEQLADE